MKRFILLGAVLAMTAVLARADNQEALRASINAIRSGQDVLPAPQAVYLRTDTIKERTANAGVTVDGVLLKDGNMVGGTGTFTTVTATYTNAAVNGAMTVGGNTTLNGSATVGTNLTVAGTSTLNGTSLLYGSITISNSVVYWKDLPLTTNSLAVGSGAVWNNSGVPTIR